MTPLLKDLNRLKLPLLFLVVMLLVMALLVYYAYLFCETQRQATEMQENLLRNARMQLQQYESEKNERAVFLPQYQALIEQGFIGEEHRQTWVSALADIQKTHHLFEIHYEIGRLTPVNASFLPAAAPFTLHQTEMKIRFALLHEGDLLKLLAALKEKDLGPYIVKSCEISNMDKSLNAACDIHWYTLMEPANTQVAPAS